MIAMTAAVVRLLETVVVNHLDTENVYVYVWVGECVCECRMAPAAGRMMKESASAADRRLHSVQ